MQPSYQLHLQPRLQSEPVKLAPFPRAASQSPLVDKNHPKNPVGIFFSFLSFHFIGQPGLFCDFHFDFPRFMVASISGGYLNAGVRLCSHICILIRAIVITRVAGYSKTFARVNVRVTGFPKFSTRR